MIGQILSGRYKIIKTLSAGGMAQTYIAQDTHRPAHPLCVVKHLQPINTTPHFLANARELFKKEAKTLDQLGTHSQIPRLLAYFEENDEFYLVQEYIDGHPLSEEFNLGHRWSELKVIDLLIEVLTILQYVHQQNVIHRDIKPDNLIRQHKDNKLILIDFGAGQEIQSRLTTNVSSEGDTVIGTYGYMPTEQSQGKPRPNSDLYALGIVAIQALTAVAPTDLQEDDKTGEILWQHLASVNPDLASIISTMVRYHFKDRYQTATEALEAIAKFKEQLQLPTIPPTILNNPTNQNKMNNPNQQPQIPVFQPYNEPQQKHKTSKTPKNQRNWLLTGIGITTVVLGTILGWNALAKATAKFGGDNVIDVGVVQYQDQDGSYQPNLDSLQDQIESKLEKKFKKDVTVKIHSIKTDQPQALDLASQNIKNKKWDLVFTTAPLLSVTAEDNDYKYLMRQFPDAPSYYPAMVVKADSKIDSISDLKAEHTIALGDFNNLSTFYIPLYDLYGKTLKVDVDNTPQEIMKKIISSEAEVGSLPSYYVENNPALKVISTGRFIDIASVYVSPKLGQKEQDLLKTWLEDADEKVKQDAEYGSLSKPDYSDLKDIQTRVEEIIGCRNLSEENTHINLYCENETTPNSTEREGSIKGIINGIKKVNGDQYNLTLQTQKGQVYHITLAKKVVEQDPNLPSPLSLNGKTVQVSKKTLSGQKLMITELGQLEVIK